MDSATIYAQMTTMMEVLRMIRDNDDTSDDAKAEDMWDSLNDPTGGTSR